MAELTRRTLLGSLIGAVAAWMGWKAAKPGWRPTVINIRQPKQLEPVCIDVDVTPIDSTSLDDKRYWEYRLSFSDGSEHSWLGTHAPNTVIMEWIGWPKDDLLGRILGV